MTRKLTMIVISGFLFLTIAAEKLAASGYFLPFLYEIPEGNVGVFRSGDQLYDGVYTPGVYPVWPSDEVLLVSVMPEKAMVRESTCLTADSVSVEFGAITVAYRVLEGGVWMLVELYGVDFVAPLIEKPLRQGLADWCANMTAEGVFLEKNGLLKQYLMDYLTNHLNVVQGMEKTGLLITGLEVSRATVPDDVIDSLLRRSVAHDQLAAEDDLSPHEPPKSDSGLVVFFSAPFEEEVDEEENGTDIVSGDPGSPEESGLVLYSGDDAPSPLRPPVTDDDMAASLPSENQITAYIEHMTAQDEMTTPPEQSLVQDDGTDVDIVQIDLPEVGADPVAVEDQQDVRQENRVSKSLWKNNSSRLYLGW